MIMKRLENSSEKIIPTLKVETVGLGFIISDYENCGMNCASFKDVNEERPFHFLSGHGLEIRV